MNITVCVGSTCYLKGSHNIINKLKKMVKDNKLEGKITIKGACCLGNCGKDVSIKLDNRKIFSINEQNIDDFFKKNILRNIK